VLDETRAFNEELRRQLAAMPGPETLPPEVTRGSRAAATRRRRRSSVGWLPA
jgi:hypothetical protein